MRKPFQPSLCDLVHYVDGNTCHAAMVVRAQPRSMAVSLVVFDPAGVTYYTHKVPRAELHTEASSWHHDHECPN